MDKNVAAILAIGAGAALSIAALLWGLAQVVPAIGIAVGSAIAIIQNGAVAAPWVASVTAVGTGAVGLAGGYFIVVKLVERARKDILAGVLPVLSIWTGVVVDFAKEYYTADPIQKVLYALLSGAVILIAGLLFERETMWQRILGLALACIPPLMFVILALQTAPEGASLTVALGGMPALTWITFVTLVATSMLVLYLARKAKH